MTGSHVRRILAILALVLALGVPSAVAEAGGRHLNSGHAGLILYANVVEGHSQLFTVRPDGSHVRQLTNVTEGDVGAPDWSPDGRRIAFELGTEESGMIGMMNADGSGFRTYPRTDAFLGQPYFAPDGKHLYVERYDLAELDAIYRTDLRGQHEQQITFPTPGAYYDTDPSVSPDGRTLSFVRIEWEDNTQSALFTVDLRTGRERQITPFSEDVAVKHGWSPDGRRLTYTRAGYEALPGVSSNVMTVRPDGTGARNLTGLTGGTSNALTGSYSPDGQWIAYRLETPDGAALMKIHPLGWQAGDSLQAARCPTPLHRLGPSGSR